MNGPFATIKAFTDHGLWASFHYADDTASGEWRLGDLEKRRALKLFDDNPGLHPAMRKVATGFLWSLKNERPQ